jgi:uncharacterized protein (TIGR03790 family)
MRAKLAERGVKLFLGLFLAGSALSAQTGANVLVVVNDNSPVSRSIGEYYALRRSIPLRNLCHIRATSEEAIERSRYQSSIANPIANCLRKNGLVESVLYIVTTLGMPLKIPGTVPESPASDASSVDSELTLLYSDISRGPHSMPGAIPNPFFGRVNDKFTHPAFPIYLVTRLAAYTFEEVKGIIDRSLSAANRGKFIIDLAGDGNPDGEAWLLDAARRLPQDRLVLDQTSTVLYHQTDVIGYAGPSSFPPMPAPSRALPTIGPSATGIPASYGSRVLRKP